MAVAARNPSITGVAFRRDCLRHHAELCTKSVPLLSGHELKKLSSPTTTKVAEELQLSGN
jgi:hypothetical protein